MFKHCFCHYLCLALNCFLWLSGLRPAHSMHPCLFGQMHLAIWTNTIGNLDKYNDQFREIHLAFCFAFSKHQGCACLQPPTSLNAALLTHRAISPRTLSATAINFLSHSQRGKYTHTHTSYSNTVKYFQCSLKYWNTVKNQTFAQIVQGQSPFWHFKIWL